MCFTKTRSKVRFLHFERAVFNEVILPLGFQGIPELLEIEACVCPAKDRRMYPQGLLSFYLSLAEKKKANQNASPKN